MQKIENMTQLSILIRQTRRTQGLTQEELSAVSGVGIRFIRELEHGKESCHFSKTLTILKMLGLMLYVNQGNYL